MELHIIRHTPVNLDKGVCYGQSDVNLNKSDLEKYLSKYKQQLSFDFDLVISSPLQRCTELVDALGYDNYQIDNRLMEMNFGDWELKKWNDIPLDESDYWMKNYDSVSTPRGESMKQLFDRINLFYQELKQKPFHKVLIITHAGPIRCFWKIILDISLKNTMKIPIDYGEIFIIDTTIDIIKRKK